MERLLVALLLDYSLHLKLLLIVFICVGSEIGKRKSNSMVWWPYSIIARYLYRHAYRLYANRFFCLHVACVPGSIVTWLLTMDWGAGALHQFIVPLFYDLYFTRRKRQRRVSP